MFFLRLVHIYIPLICPLRLSFSKTKNINEGFGVDNSNKMAQIENIYITLNLNIPH